MAKKKELRPGMVIEVFDDDDGYAPKGTWLYWLVISVADKRLVNLLTYKPDSDEFVSDIGQEYRYDSIVWDHTDRYRVLDGS